jgi:polar amino acid transport system substrate-binding protein
METVTEILEAVQNQTADAAIAGISMTPEREQKVDFSHPFFDAGLQIMARADSRPTLLQWIRQFITPALLGLLAIGIIFSLIMGHVIWLVERRRNPDFQQGYLRGVWEGIWWLFGVIATGEYPDKETHSVIKRILTVGWWLIGVALIAQLTGTIASSMTVQQLQSSINGPQDLPGKHIITVQGSTAAQYLDRQSIRYSVVEQIQAAYPLLEDGKVDAIVYDSPVLLYYAANQGQGRVQVVGPIFKPEKYGIALQTGSQLRKPINEALLGIYQDGTYEILYQKWFGQGE